MSDHLDNVTKRAEASKTNAGDGMRAVHRGSPGRTDRTMTTQPAIDNEITRQKHSFQRLERAKKFDQRQGFAGLADLGRASRLCVGHRLPRDPLDWLVAGRA